MDSEAPRLAVDAVSFAYRRGRPVLHEVSLGVGAGEVVGLVGPNGSGKSTLIRLISDLLELESGGIRIAGVPHRDRSSKMAMVYLPSEDYLPEFLSGTEYVRLILTLYRVDGVAADAIEEMFERLGMAGRHDHLIEDYSHGMRKKVQITAAVLARRPITIVDETFNGIDLDALAECRLQMLRARAEGRSFLVCSHDFTLLENVADRVVVLSQGAVRSDVPVREVRARGARLADVVGAVLQRSG